MAIGSIALLSCALILPMHPLVRPRSPQCMMKSYDTSKPYDAASSPEPLGEEEEELMATLVEPAADEPAVVEPAADDTAAIGDDEQELLMALRRARARGGVAELIELGRAIETADSAGVDAECVTMVEARQYAEENGGFLVKVADTAAKAAESVGKAIKGAAPISDDEQVAKDVAGVVGALAGAGTLAALGFDIASLDLDFLVVLFGAGAAVLAEDDKGVVGSTLRGIGNVATPVINATVTRRRRSPSTPRRSSGCTRGPSPRSASRPPSASAWAGPPPRRRRRLRRRRRRRAFDCRPLVAVGGGGGRDSGPGRPGSSGPGTRSERENGG